MEELTKEEAANHLKTVAKSAIDVGYDGAVVDAVAMALQAMERQHWIPVEERLPGKYEDVLLWYEGFADGEPYQAIGVGSVDEEGEWFGDTPSNKRIEVIAWMPLPEPYKEVTP